MTTNRKSDAITGRVRVCRVPDITHEEWLEFRRTGIGGSDASTIVGLNPYSSLFYLYNDKLGLLPPKQDSEAMRQGRDLEQYVADRWMEATGKRCQRNNYMWRSLSHPFMLADIDREVVGENAGLECKTTSVYNKADLANGEIPLTYYVQCLHYMTVMGYDRMYLAVLVLNKGFYHFVIEWDEEEAKRLIKQEEAFWTDHILPQQPPPPDGSYATLSALEHLYPDGQTDGIVPLSHRAISALRTIEELTEQSKLFEDAIRAEKALIMQELQDTTAGVADQYKVTWRSQSSSRLDSKRLKQDHPELYREYTRTTTSRVFRIKKLKGDSEDV